MTSILAGAPLAALQPNNRMAIRSAVNPYDKATVFSIYPHEIRQDIPTVQPAHYIIPAGTYEQPARVVVGPASWWRDVDPEDRSQPLLEITVSSIQIADSLCRDHINARLGSNGGDSVPGLFYLPGDVTVDKIKGEFRRVLDDANRKQRNWYLTLVKLGDAMWARAQGNPLALSDEMRLAARELGMEKPWNQDFKQMQMVSCPACGHMRNPMFPICGHCKFIVDKKRAEELGIIPGPEVPKA